MFRSKLRTRGGVALIAAMLHLVGAARAADSPGGDNVAEARAEFVAATEHVKDARWGEALAAFERSNARRPHALTTYNIGACERALGRLTRARVTLRRALEADQASGQRELPRSFADEARTRLDEIASSLVLAGIALNPPDATLLVDGLAVVPDETERGTYVAGLRSSGREVKAPGAAFVLVLDPGVHVFSLSRAGFANAVVQRTLAPGERVGFRLDLKSLPATLSISADRAGSAVAIDGVDVGTAPVEVSRAAGTYRIAVRREGYVSYLTNVRVNPGDHPTLHATLPQESTPVTQKAWFWTLAGVVVAGVAVGTYFATRPAPERPQPDGGGLGWSVTVPAGP